MTYIRLLGIALAAAVVASAAQAETVTLRTILNGETEVPAVTTPGKGTAQVTVDTTAKTVHWKVDYADLTGPVVAAHIHGPAMPGANAGPMVPLTAGPSPMEGSASVTDAQIADMLAGRSYINLHTAAHGPGEVRGYLAK
jgi:hypothetical protein